MSLARRVARVGLAVFIGACGGRAHSSSDAPQLAAGGAGGTPASEPVPAEGVAGSTARGVGGASGGASESTNSAGSSATATPGGGSGSVMDPSQAGAAGEAPTALTCAALAAPLRAELVWQDAFTFYGTSDYPFIGFSPDGAELMMPIAESPNQQGNRGYGVASGELVAHPLPAILGRDAAWSRQLVSVPGATVYFGDVVELPSGKALLSLASDPLRSLQVRISDDGQYLFRVTCDGGLRVERLRISDGEVASVALGSGQSLCVGYGHPTFVLPLTASRTNDTVVVGAERRGFAVADFASGSATFSVPSDDPSLALERKPNQPLSTDALSLELGPKERSLATIDASGALRLLSYPELVQSSPAIPTAVTSAFEQAYATRRALAPIAWSPDERYVATADDAHATVVRRACDGSVAVTLPPPNPDPARPDEDPNWAPAFLAFNRQGLGLAVLRVNPRFRATVSYYELSSALPN